MTLARPFACLTLLAALLAPSASAQVTLFEADFNAGIAGWTKINNSGNSDQWTVGFGLVNGSGDINHNFFCSFGGITRNNYIYSPSIDLSDVTNASLSYDQFHDVFNGINGTTSYNRVEVSTNGGSSWTLLYNTPASPQPSGFSSNTLDLAAYVGQSDVRIGFHYRSVVGNDWSVDNVKVTTDIDPWVDLGQSLAGGGGAPVLAASGKLVPSSPINIDLSNAAPTSTAYLVVGFTELNLPFYGGTLVPGFEPPLGTFFTLFTNGGGNLPIAAVWPSGIPSGFELVLQYWIVDGGAPFGLAASNAVKGTVP